MKQFIWNKPDICGTDGYPRNLQIYKGKETGPKLEALGPRVVEDMASIIRHEDADKHILYYATFSQAINYLITLRKRI